MRSGTNVRTAIELYGERDGLCKQQLRLFGGDENRVQPDEKEYECFFYKYCQSGPGRYGDLMFSVLLARVNRYDHSMKCDTK